jgi:hypothetical protein
MQDAMSYLTTKRFILGMLFCFLVNPLFAAKPMLLIELAEGSSSNHVISTHGSVIVEYVVKNELAIPIVSPFETLRPRTHVASLRSSARGCHKSRTLAPGDTCVLSLLISGTTHGGPYIESRPFSASMHEASLLKNSFWGSTPPPAQQLSVDESSVASEATLSVSPTSLSLTAGNPGSSGIVTITNTNATIPANMLTWYVSSPDLVTVVTGPLPPGGVVCPENLAGGASCTLQITAGSTATPSGEPVSVEISASNAAAPVPILVTIN